MTDHNIDEGVTENPDQNDTQMSSEKTYTQEELNAIVARNVSKATKKFEGFDADEYRQLKEESEKAKRKEQMRKGEYEKIIEEMTAKHNAEKQQWMQEKSHYKITDPIKSVLAKKGVRHIDQVQKLVEGNFRLGDDGEVEVVDSEGKMRFNNEGKVMSVEDYLNDYLDQNPHFLPANPSTTTSKSNHTVNPTTGDFVPGETDLSKPENREKARQAGYVR